MESTSLINGERVERGRKRWIRRMGRGEKGRMSWIETVKLIEAKRGGERGDM